MRSILDTAFDAIVSIDQSGCIVDFNNAATRMFGLGEDAPRQADRPT